MKQRLQQVLARPVSRRTFLAQLGGALLAIVGISAILKAFELQRTGSGIAESDTYSASAYGGRGQRPFASRPRRVI